MSRTAIVAVTVVVLIAFLSPWMGFAQQNTLQDAPVRVYPEKDPFVAGLLSWLMMGTGQMYCREYTKGSIFIAADLADKTAFVLDFLFWAAVLSAAACVVTFILHGVKRRMHRRDAAAA